MFELIWMYTEIHNTDMWHVKRVTEVEGKPDYYGPFFNKIIDKNFKDHKNLNA